jgi:2-polyprenyl-6-methoxyphenol hydroxylase-like FAD-dependent oxidoreductase
MTFGRVALIGDAAFVGRPHVGLGVTKAVADAKCLADSLSAAGDDVESGLKSFNDVRKPIGDRVVARGRELGALLNSGIGNVSGDHHDLLRNTAADQFLRQ